jgi:Tol biopolymer transport system component
MTATRDLDLVIRAWLDLMPDEAPDRVIESVLDGIELTPQTRRSRARAATRLVLVPALAAAAVIVLAAGSIAFLQAFPNIALPPATALPAISPASPGTPPSSAASPVPGRSPRSSSAQLQPGEPWILYVGEPPGTPGLYLARPDASGLHRIAWDVSGEIGEPAWFANGNEIAFVLNGRTPAGSIWQLSADGSSLRRLYDAGDDCPAGLSGPGLSPDGWRAAFVCRARLSSSLHLLDIASGAVSELTSVTEPEMLVGPPDWSPDGATIAFEIVAHDPSDPTTVTGSLIATIAPAGGAPQRITAFDSNAAYPDWSRDGKRLSFNTYDLREVRGYRHGAYIATMAADGSGVRQLTDDGFLYRAGEARWLPDGASLLAVTLTHSTPPELVHVDAETGAVVQIGLNGRMPAPRPLP